MQEQLNTSDQFTDSVVEELGENIRYEQYWPNIRFRQKDYKSNFRP